MLSLHHHDDIVQLHFSSRRSRLAGYAVNAYFARGVLIDTGFPGVARDVASALDRLRPAAAAITHWHEDHAGNVDLAAHRGIAIAASAATLSILRARPEIGLYRKAVWGAPSDLWSAIEHAELPELELIPTPGHSVDHHVVWDPERERVFSGDLFLGVKVRSIHGSEDPRAHAASIRRVIALRPRLLLDGHRGPMPDPVPMLTAKADWIEATVAEVERLAGRGWSDRRIARQVLGRAEPITYVTFGDLSPLNFVRAVRRGPSAPEPASLRSHGE